ncbi:unnamed protein product [Fusarium graminearum]|uniref:Uncharacterized protein n=1 Tax=Gibberella zeae TaxID=5518 RepID=A0A4E9E538_GIBZA|nr:unnamed protein product [Fusarium graminearum]CAF3494063.1 unnamed protein product [Fusarium graminearum]CAG1976514.1 unnamed protein product [Fusarium graminearum]CAG2010219.1 unnamed protein product [Fusarium graminearum]
MSAFDVFLPPNYLIREDCLGLVNQASFGLFFEVLPFIEVHSWPTAILIDPEFTVVLWAQRIFPSSEWVDMTHDGVRRTLTELADSGASCAEYQMVIYWFMKPLVVTSVRVEFQESQDTAKQATVPKQSANTPRPNTAAREYGKPNQSIGNKHRDTERLGHRIDPIAGESLNHDQ